MTRCCLWGDCQTARSGNTLWCLQHRQVARMAHQSGALPSRYRMETMRPSQIRDITRDLPSPAPACIWPGCRRPPERSRATCRRCYCRYSRLIVRGFVPKRSARVLSDAERAALPGLWALHIKQERERQREVGISLLARRMARAAAITNNTQQEAT